MEQYILAYDFGTSGVKAALVDFCGKLLGHEEQSYPLLSVSPGYAEQDPAAYWSAVCIATRGVLRAVDVRPEDVAAMSFGTQGMGIIPVDEAGNTLHNNITWVDSRARAQADEINARAGTHLVDASDTVSKILWFKQNRPELYDKTKYILDCTGFLTMKATGVMASDYTGCAPYSPSPAMQETMQHLYRDLAGIDLAKFPPLIPGSGYVGNLTPQAAAELGVTTAARVYMGVVDVTCAAAGAGCCREGDVHVYLGTSGWITALIGPEYLRETSTGIYQVPGLDTGNLIYGGCVQAACLALNWTIDNFYKVEKQVLQGKPFEFITGQGSVFDYINREVEQVPPGSNGVFAAPWLMGERCPIMDEQARGVFLGISSLTDRRDMVNAMMECICYSLRSQLEYYRKDTGKLPERVGAIGGGALSDHWMQMMADVLNTPVYRPCNCRHSGAIGSAAIAAVGMGMYRHDEIDRFVQIDRVFEPDPEHVATYNRLYETWQEIYPALKGIFPKLH